MTPDNAEKMLLRAEIIRLAEQEALHGEIQWIRASPGTLCCELPTRCSQLTYKKYISTGWMLMLKDVIGIMGEHFSCEGAFINEMMC